MLLLKEHFDGFVHIEQRFRICQKAVKALQILTIPLTFVLNLQI